MRVTVKSNKLDNIRPYNGKNYGEQQAALDTGGDFPLVFKLNRLEGEGYPAGVYTLDPRSFVTDTHGNLNLKRVQLLPVKA